MSRAYRISLSESSSVSRRLEASDGLSTELELIDVLGAEAMTELLVVELEARGFARAEHGDMVRRDDDGVEISVAVAGECAGRVTVRLCRDAEVEVSAKRSANAEVGRAGEAKEMLRDKVARDIELKLAREEKKLADQVTEVLDKKLRDIRAELASIANRVTGAGLKVRAAQLGEIREITEDPDTGSLTIKVRV